MWILELAQWYRSKYELLRCFMAMFHPRIEFFLLDLFKAPQLLVWRNFLHLSLYISFKMHAGILNTLKRWGKSVVLSVVSTFWYRTYCVILCFFCSFNCRFITLIEIIVQGCFERITIKKFNQGYSTKIMWIRNRA